MGTLLVVDDIAGNTRLLESLLAPDGHTVRTAGDGAEALHVVRAERPDLVLMDVIKQHTVIGDRLCGELRSLRNVRPIVRHHHERLDGSGYPDGLRDEAIPLLAQIYGDRRRVRRPDDGAAVQGGAAVRAGG